MAGVNFVQRHRTSLPTERDSLPASSVNINRRRILGQSSIEVINHCSFVKYYSLPIGTLQIRKTKNSLRRSRQPTPENLLGSEVHITFVPPPWLSSLALRCSISIRQHQSEQEFLRFTLRPCNVNHNALLLEAIQTSDISVVAIIIWTKL